MVGYFCKHTRHPVKSARRAEIDRRRFENADRSAERKSRRNELGSRRL